MLIAGPHSATNTCQACIRLGDTETKIEAMALSLPSSPCVPYEEAGRTVVEPVLRWVKKPIPTGFSHRIGGEMDGQGSTADPEVQLPWSSEDLA
jgi:hypothetical protein